MIVVWSYGAINQYEFNSWNWSGTSSAAATPNKTFGLSSMINEYGASVDCSIAATFGLDSAITTTTGLSSIVNTSGIGLDGTATSTSGYSGEL